MIKNLLKNKFELSETFSSNLKKYFKDEYESKEKKPLITENEYSEKKTQECCQALTEAHKQLLVGINTFLEREDDEFSIEVILKKFQKVADLNSTDIHTHTISELLEISDTDFIKMYTLATTELNGNNLKEASAMFFFLCWLNPTVYTPLMGWGLAEALLGNRSKAHEIYQLCLPLAPHDPYLYFYLAVNSQLSDNMSQSKEYLEKAHHLATENKDEPCLEMIEQFKRR